MWLQIIFIPHMATLFEAEGLRGSAIQTVGRNEIGNMEKIL